MNTARQRKLLLFSLYFSLSVLLCGCGAKSEIKKTITEELDLLKNLDSDTVRKYISYDELFPDTAGENSTADEIEEVFALFFKDFNYKIMDITVDKKTGKADASVRLSTIDAYSLAKDFVQEILESEILKTAAGLSDSGPSLEEHYLLLNHLLKTNTYKTAENNCTIKLVHADSKSHLWDIKRTVSLEDDLVGGLISYLSNPDLLSPEETLSVYLSTLQKMSLEEMVSYLEIESILNSSDESKNRIAEALAEQIHEYFGFSINQCKINGYTAIISVDVTTFDSKAILSSYQNELDVYLSSSDAVIDGSEKRRQKSLNLLLDSIKNNTKTTAVRMDLTLINDGASWKLQNAGKTLGKAFFGELAKSDELT